MTSTPVNYEFTPSELATYLFKKKVCPICGGRLEKRKDYTMKMGREMQKTGNKYYMDNEPVRDYKISYYCAGCDHTFTLDDLAKK